MGHEGPADSSPFPPYKGGVAETECPGSPKRDPEKPQDEKVILDKSGSEYNFAEGQMPGRPQWRCSLDRRRTLTPITLEPDTRRRGLVECRRHAAEGQSHLRHQGRCMTQRAHRVTLLGGASQRPGPGATRESEEAGAPHMGGVGAARGSGPYCRDGVAPEGGRQFIPSVRLERP